MARERGGTPARRCTLTWPACPVHGPAPPLQGRSSATAIFQTGIKVIDLLSPLPRGEKSAMFRADGVGKTVVRQHEVIGSINVDGEIADVRCLTCFPNVADAFLGDPVELSYAKAARQRPLNGVSLLS